MIPKVEMPEDSEIYLNFNRTTIYMYILLYYRSNNRQILFVHTIDDYLFV